MPAIPLKKVIKTKRHEWVIGSESEPTSAKDFEFGLHFVKQEMESIGVDLGFDDAYFVRAGDGGEVIVFVDIKERA